MSCNCNGEHNHSHGLHEGCQCNDNHHGNMDMIYLTLEDGSELKCEVVVVYEVEDKEYMVLLPEGGNNVFLYEYEESEEGPKLSIIEDDNEFNKVAEVYNSMIEGEIGEE